MVFVDVTRVSGEAASESPVNNALSRQSLEVAAAPSSGATTRVTRVVVEVAVETPAIMLMPRESLEVAASPSAGAMTRVTRLVGEVAIDVPAKNLLSKQSLEVMQEPSTGSAPVRVARVFGEFAVRRDSPRPIPIPLPTDLTWWMHNWVTVPSLTTSFLTDVTEAPSHVAESRRALRAKPQRGATVRLGPVQGVGAVDLLIQHAKRFVRERMVMPLYPDKTPLLADAVSAATSLTFDTRYGRFFPGGRIAAFILDPRQEIVDVRVYQMDQVTGTGATLFGTVGTNLSASATRIMPLIDVRVRDRQRLQLLLQGDTAEATFEVEEVGGDSALPVLAIGAVDFASDGLAIWPYDHDWTRDLEFEYRREGVKLSEGRNERFEPHGERERMVHSYQLADAREPHAQGPGLFEAIRFFEAHRGRLAPFWHMDQECLWTVVNWRTGGNAFLFDVSPLNTFPKFQERIQETDHVGILMKDGRRFVREVVTITSGASWQLTVSEALPAAYTAADVEQLSVARKTRFGSDSRTEEWEAPVAGRVSHELVELLSEEDFTL